jgi:hypothetical protein
VSNEVVGLFARSSSCVEGRNGRLALFHHGQTRLSAGRLNADFRKAQCPLNY